MDRGLLALAQRMSALESDDTESLNELLREVGESDGQSYVDRKVTEPGLVAPTLAGIRDVDLVYSAAVGARYFCGADFRADQIRATHADFGEFDGYGTLSFRV